MIWTTREVQITVIVQFISFGKLYSWMGPWLGLNHMARNYWFRNNNILQWFSLLIGLILNPYKLFSYSQSDLQHMFFQLVILNCKLFDERESVLSVNSRYTTLILLLRLPGPFFLAAHIQYHITQNNSSILFPWDSSIIPESSPECSRKSLWISCSSSIKWKLSFLAHKIRMDNN